MKTLKLFFIVALAICLMPSLLEAQTAPTRTTLSAAMAAGARQMVVTSASGFTASSGSQQYFVLIENDLRQVLSVSSTTIGLGPSRGASVGHVSGSTVIFGTPGNWLTGTAGATAGSTGVFPPSLPTGSCSRGNQQYLPMFVPASSTGTVGGTIDCLGGEWVVGTLPDAGGLQPALLKYCTVPIGSVAYGSFGTSTTTSATVEYTANIFVPRTMYVTGFTNLNGSAVDTNSKKIFILKDTAGKILANTATAGTAATGNDAFQAIAFTSAVYAVGPAWHFVGLQDDTADTNGIRTIAASTFNGVLASGPTSVFGTIAELAIPTTFTADVGPIGCLY